jgi:hypothetical protein
LEFVERVHIAIEKQFASNPMSRSDVILVFMLSRLERKAR